uniref:Peptidase_M16 domain-containing protein n=1 Tax=Heterorhabditis bacteriophora TaxID=37862 RepID=A0A1I7WYZ4_HETBA
MLPRFVVTTSLRPVLSNQQVRSVASLSVKDILSNQPLTEVTTLKNGFRVATEDNGKPTATVGVWIETGSRFETEKNNGISHFLERLIHKGTGKRTCIALENELGAIGAKLNSFTSRDHSGVYVQASAQDVEKGLYYNYWRLSYIYICICNKLTIAF